MERAIAKEVLVVFAVAALAVALLLLARFAGSAFTTQTYLWSLGILYVVRVLVWAFRTVRGNHQASTPQHEVAAPKVGAGVRYATFAGLLVFAFLVAGCNASAPPTATAPSLTPEEILARARDAMSEVQSYRFMADLSGQTDAGVQQAHFTGEWASPDRYRMRVEGVGEGEGHVHEVVSVGGRVLSSDSDYQDGAWTEQRAMPPGALSSSSMIPELGNTALLKDDVTDGLAVYHVTGTSTSDVVQGVPAPVSTYDLFIGKEDMLLRRLIIETDFSGLAESAPSGEDYVPISQRVTYDFYDYDQPVKIELPEVSS